MSEGRSSEFRGEKSDNNGVPRMEVHVRPIFRLEDDAPERSDLGQI